MHSERRLGEFDSFLTEDNTYGIKVLSMTVEVVGWLWSQMSQYRTLFSDVTANDLDNYTNLVTLPNTLWYHVVRKDTGDTVGVLYVTDVQPATDMTVHVMFFDRKFTDKVNVTREHLKWVCRQLRVHRATAVIPDIYHATIRFAERVGFVLEGTRRESISIGGRWCNELLFGVLTTEL